MTAPCLSFLANNTLGLLYDHRDEFANINRAIMHDVVLFHKLTEGEKTSVASGSNTLFALASIHAPKKTSAGGVRDVYAGEWSYPGIHSC